MQEEPCDQRFILQRFWFTCFVKLNVTIFYKGLFFKVKGS